jgi:hypothetical protein
MRCACVIPPHDRGSCANARIQAARAALFMGMYDHRREPRRNSRHVRLLNPHYSDEVDATMRRFAQLEIDD